MTVPDLLTKFRFRVEIDGVTIAGFCEVTGLEISIEPIEYREGGDRSIRKIPGLTKFGDVTLKRGITNAHELEDWIKNVSEGQPDRRNAVITLLDEQRQEIARWVLVNTFPRKWEGPDLNAKSSEVAIESLTLCVERLERST
jgi:phage tail-like protein